MFPGMELMGCQDLAVPAEVMQHVVRVESSFNPYAIGVVGAKLARQPKNLPEALATVRMLEDRGYNFSLGLAQVNRKNLSKYGLDSYEKAFQSCPNLQAGSRILAECYSRSKGDWPKSFSCYYSGDFKTGFRHGYVQKVYASIRSTAPASAPSPHALAVPILDSVARCETPEGSPPPTRRADPEIARSPDTVPVGQVGSDSWVETSPAESRMPVRVSLVGQLPALRPMDQGMQVAQVPQALSPNAASTPAQSQTFVDSAFVF